MCPYTTRIAWSTLCTQTRGSWFEYVLWSLRVVLLIPLLTYSSPAIHYSDTRKLTLSSVECNNLSILLGSLQTDKSRVCEILNVDVP